MAKQEKDLFEVRGTCTELKDMFVAFKADNDNVKSDNDHLNSRGDELEAKTLSTSFSPLLPNPPPP